MRIYLKVVPKSSQEKVEELENGNFKVWTAAVAEKGKANDAVVKILAKHFGVAKNKIEIVGGKTSRDKIVSLNE